MNIQAKIDEGEIISMTVKKYDGEKIAKYDANAQKAELVRIYTHLPRKLQESMEEVLETEYIEEIVLFENDGNELVIDEYSFS